MNSQSKKVTASLLICLSLTGRAIAVEADDYLGRWNIKIEDTSDTFSTAWLQLQNSAQGQQGKLVWRWGSVDAITDITIDDSGLRFQRGNDSYSARLVGEELRGVARMGNGKRFPFLGKAANEMCDVTGTWHANLTTDPAAEPGRLVLQQLQDRVSGRAYDPQGNAYAVQDGKLAGTALSFRATPMGVDAPTREVQVEIQGDVLAGRVKVPVPGQAEPAIVMIQGQRQREWAHPIHLLASDSLDGWGPRDPRKKFGWKITNGVLENSPPDVDIISDAKFRDFQLHVEYQVDANSNSGIYLRGRYELQILGNTEVRDHGNMAVYSRLKPKKNPLRPGEWNALDVTFIGRWLTVALNGETVHDNQYLEGPTGGAWDPLENQPGPLLLQGDHGKVYYRNIIVTPSK